MRHRLSALAVACVLAALAWELPQLRRRLLYDVTHWDAVPGPPAAIPGGAGLGIGPAVRTRVVLIDGLSAEVASKLRVWQGLCGRGVAMRVDVGFPTVSLPIEVTLWSGLTQQQTGIVNRYERPLDPPLVGIPSRVPDSWAIAENHGWIVRSLGFSHTEPAADPADPVRDADPDTWKAAWQAHASSAVASPARLVFVHILRVDTAGHEHGGESPEYRAAASEADAILEALHELDRGARWFLLSDHGHLPGPHGGHGGEERDLRQVEGCIVGPGVAPRRGPLVHLVDVSRAIADSTGTTLDRESRGRPLGAALDHPLGPDDALPAMTLGAGAAAILVLAVGFGLTIAAARVWWLAPWWFVLGGVALVMIRGEPTLSAPFVYPASGREMYLVWLPLLALAFAATVFGVRRTTILRVVAAQLAVPLAAAAAALTACGAWRAVFGAEVAPVVPRFTAYTSPLLLMASHGAAAVALAALATLVRPAFGRRAPPAPPRTEPPAG
ncbi:MAG TPA: alkaline phosphatase family protein [Kofleriaceae bacterium]|nr:alkaline phosphatase family protein [Kofleriaceae bacterium]